MTQDSTDIIDLARRYFRQQVELYGEEVVLDRAAAETRSGVEGPQSSNQLESFYQEIKDCQKCALGRSRKNLVFGAGNPQARVMLIGEAPGADEDRLGKPFVGRAGQLLNKLLQAVGFGREEVYIGNILKCRPPGNRDPLPEEIGLCQPHLRRQIEIIGPDFILALGRIAAQTLLKTTLALGKLRGQVHEIDGIKLVVTYHPAALLRFPQYEKATMQDLLMLRRLYDEKYA